MQAWRGQWVKKGGGTEAETQCLPPLLTEGKGKRLAKSRNVLTSLKNSHLAVLSQLSICEDLDCEPRLALPETYVGFQGIPHLFSLCDGDCSGESRTTTSPDSILKVEPRGRFNTDLAVKVRCTFRRADGLLFLNPTKQHLAGLLTADTVWIPEHYLSLQIEGTQRVSFAGESEQRPPPFLLYVSLGFSSICNFISC